MNKPSQQEQENMIQQAGRDHAAGMMQNVVENCKDVEQLNMNIHVLQCSAIHVLANNAFNRIKSFGTNKAQLIMEIKEQIEDELDLILKHEDDAEIVTPK